MTARRQRTKSPTIDINLRNELRSLQRENARLRELLGQHNLLHRSSPESTQNGSTPPKIPSSTNVAEVTPKRRTRCSCQGKCATRVCGCVKKDMPCGKFCRCAHDQCQNQPDKENNGEQVDQELPEAGQENLRKLASLSIKDAKESKGESDRSERRVENRKKKPGLFSPPPSTSSDRQTRRQQESETEPLASGRERDREISTTNDDEVFDSDDAAEERHKSKTTRRVPGRSRRQNLAPVRPKQRSSSATDGQQEDEAIAQVEKAPQRRTTSLGDSSNEKAQKPKKNKTLAVVLNGTRPLRRAVAAKLGEASSENIEDPEANNQKVEEINKKAKKTAKGKSKKKNNSNAQPTDEEQAEVNELLEVVANNIQLVAAQQTIEAEPQNEKTPPRPTENLKAEPETHSIDNIKVANVKTEPPQIEFVPFEDPAHHQQSPSGSSTGSSPRFDQLPIDDPNFNPMKPRHNLTRSPLGSNTHSRTFLDISERPLVPPMEEAADEELPPPEELNNIIVDWDKHQQERVYCSKCKRGFYPYRIKKHEASCKKV